MNRFVGAFKRIHTSNTSPFTKGMEAVRYNTITMNTLSGRVEEIVALQSMNSAYIDGRRNIAPIGDITKSWLYDQIDGNTEVVSIGQPISSRLKTILMISILKRRMKKMNKHKWKKYRRTVRNSTRYNIERNKKIQKLRKIIKMD